MIIYNITVNIHESVHEAWLNWAQETYIPAMLDTKKFTKARMVKVLVEEEMGGTTYSLQFETPSMELLQQYYNQDAQEFENQSQSLFGELMLSFKTELELIREY